MEVESCYMTIDQHRVTHMYMYVYVPLDVYMHTCTCNMECKHVHVCDIRWIHTSTCSAIHVHCT